VIKVRAPRETVSGYHQWVSASLVKAQRGMQGHIQYDPVASRIPSQPDIRYSMDADKWFMVQPIVLVLVRQGRLGLPGETDEE